MKHQDVHFLFEAAARASGVAPRYCRSDCNIAEVVAIVAVDFRPVAGFHRGVACARIQRETTARP